jgi:D-serine deaminase-like pyridoxal phosphate-dependent protein
MHNAPRWYALQQEEATDTPSLLVYPQRIRHNIAQALSWVGGKPSRLMPHVKTHKMGEVTAMMLEQGITRFKCATIAEAEMLGRQKAPHVVLAKPPVGTTGQRLVKLVEAYPETRFHALLEEEATAAHLASLAQQQQVTLGFYLDLNVGMDRTGIRPDGQAEATYAALCKLTGLLPSGLHAYDGHIGGGTPASRAEKAMAAMQAVYALQASLKQQGLPVGQLITGGTPTFGFHASHPDSICSPGTFALWDYAYGNLYPEYGFLPAACLVTRVISRPQPQIVCLDLGYKAVAAEKPLASRAFFPDWPEALPLSHSEEHLTLQLPAEEKPGLGSLVYAIPYHICPTCALYEKVLTVEDGVLTGQWRVLARDRTIRI